MKKKVALLAGGYTGESVVSLNSAKQIEASLDTERYEVYKIIVTPEEWYFTDTQNEKVPVNRADFSLDVQGERIKFDVVFIIIHGSPGEDGKLQSYFDLLNIPYTTCDATTSALTMNKAYTKAVVNGIDKLHIANSVQLFENDAEQLEKIKMKLQLPLFVKPNNGGSSIGMSKVNAWEELASALDKAFAEDTQILVEEFIEGREFTVGIYKAAGEVHVLPITEIKSSKEFFDYEAKYTKGVTEEITPAQIDDGLAAKVGKIAQEIFVKLNCRGVVRVDFIVQKNTENFYFIEINTVPGQSENSLIPQQVRATGQSMKSFYSLLIEEALAE
ncbi:D-alanine--D-alanine ligase A [Pelobium manganitolerans]|uniref:D-alanine--D-alanine ligase n=1 Tax=Pelobium manganitolerans TaxID=1842495 RepID=A0A419S5E5_9SPHI|nr:D-alanine--D-alanine ligase [Pelobium manganitolerans]RKD16062.1 D-alanine--D-alanine ligase A [Pelobium manganitolerans]